MPLAPIATLGASLQKAGALLGTFYPQRLHVAFLVNAPTWSAIIWKLICECHEGWVGRWGMRSLIFYHLESHVRGAVKGNQNKQPSTGGDSL